MQIAKPSLDIRQTADAQWGTFGTQGGIMYIILVDGQLTDDFNSLVVHLLYAEKCNYDLKELRAQHTEYVRRVVVEGSGKWENFETWLKNYREFKSKDVSVDTKGNFVHWNKEAR